MQRRIYRHIVCIFWRILSIFDVFGVFWSIFEYSQRARAAAHRITPFIKIAALAVCTRHVPAHRAPPATDTDRQTDRRLSNRRAAAELYYMAGIQCARTHARQPPILNIACVHIHIHTDATFARRA